MLYDNEIIKVLSNINKKYNNIIPRESITDLSYQKEILDKINSYPSNMTIDNLIELCIYLFNYQIFTDGNSRTFYEFLDTRLNLLGYKIDFDMVRMEYDYLRKFFPVVYLFEDDEITMDDINKIKKFIVKDYKKVSDNIDNSNNRPNRGR